MGKSRFPGCNGQRSKANECIPSSLNFESECHQMDSISSKLSLYTALSVVTIFVTISFFICWKLRASRGKEPANYICSELPALVPSRSSLKQSPSEHWVTHAPSVDAFTESEPLERVLQDFVENRNKEIEKQIFELRRQENDIQAHRYLDTLCVNSPKSSLCQASNLSQQSLYVTSDRASDPVYNVINKEVVAEPQKLRRSHSVSERGIQFSPNSSVPGNFLGAISKKEAFRTIRET